MLTSLNSEGDMMSEPRPAPRRKKRGVGGAMIAGALLVPLSAVAAVALVGALSGDSTAAATELASSSTTAAVVPVTAATTTTVADVNTLEEACSSGADELVRREQDNTLTDLEVAALSALRELCGEAGMPIAAPSAPEPVVRVVTRTEPAPTTSNRSTTAAPSTITSDEDDRYEGEGHEDEEHEEEHHHEEEDD